MGCWQLEMEGSEQRERAAVQSSHGHGTDLPSSAQVQAHAPVTDAVMHQRTIGASSRLLNSFVLPHPKNPS